ncbi:MAG: ABC transporter permease subunit [Acidobacteria bacterium]|nr:ABC transporter permease subunit [Acidobacteriota bacterium]
MVGKPLKPWQSMLVMWLSVIIILAGYTFLSNRQHEINANDKTIPTWSQLKEGIQKIVEKNERSGERWLVEDAKASAERLFLGLFYGFFGALFLGLFMGCFPLLDSGLSWPLSILSKLPPTAALALFFVVLGVGTNMYVGVIVVGILPISTLTIRLATRDIPKELINKALTLGASKGEMVFSVIFRHILPKVIDTLRLQIGPALVFLIAAEYACAHVGFGYRLRLQARLVNMDVVYPYLVILILFGFTFDFLLVILQKLTCRWYVEERSGEHGKN